MNQSSLRLHLYKFVTGTVLGIVIACSPTKFTPVSIVNNLCDATTSQCVTQQGVTDITQNFEVGSGKVDILFINDNSASMSVVQEQLAAKFFGFIQNLDTRKIDYRIAITTTDLESVKRNNLIVFQNGNSFLSNSDNDRVSQFNSAIVRSETLQCENLIISMFNKYGTGFQSTSDYANKYSTMCPSPDTRGLYTGNIVISNNASSFIRSDANLNVILISNDDVRQSKLPLDNDDTAAAFTSMIQQKYPGKYWDFNSIIVKDSTCKQSQILKNAQGQVVSNQNGPAISGGIGLEYAKLSNSAAVDIDNNPRPRGQILDICQTDYAQNFNSMATQISDSARMINLKCSPTVAPMVTVTGGSSSSTIPYTWSGDKITFQHGSEGIKVSISYKCYNGVK